MYRGFSLSLPSGSYSFYYEVGLNVTADLKKQIHSDLDRFLSPDGVIDGSKLKQNWFPSVSTNVFISHSHRDETDAIALAGYLSTTFGLTSFIDSCIWGYANDLLWKIDNRFCRNSAGEAFSYEKRNNSTGHVHMILSTALSEMIDKSECLFFLNTPNSISTAGEIQSGTKSPWIYSEIAMSHIIRKKVPERFNQIKTKAFSAGGVLESFNKRELEVEYKLSLDHLQDMDISHLEKWERNRQLIHMITSNSLDGLYDILPLIKL